MRGIGMSACVDMDLDVGDTSVWVPSEVARILGAGSDLFALFSSFDSEGRSSSTKSPGMFSDVDS
jgi:hypothetical protein